MEVGRSTVVIEHILFCNYASPVVDRDDRAQVVFRFSSDMGTSDSVHGCKRSPAWIGHIWHGARPAAVHQRKSVIKCA